MEQSHENILTKNITFFNSNEVSYNYKMPENSKAARAVYIYLYTSAHWRVAGRGGGAQGQAYTLIFWLQFANNRHQAEMVGVDQPQTRK